MEEYGFLFRISAWVLPILIAIPLHEASHGWVAWKLGDDTAYKMGRVTFNPLNHIDPFGTIILPGTLLIISGGTAAFGYAKPVPINYWNLKHWRRDTILVAAAGPTSNLILAFLSALLFYIVPFVPQPIGPWLGATIYSSMVINLILFVFNMLPLPPLDGGRVAVAILPWQLGQLFARLERAGIVIILIALFLLPWIGREVGLDVDVFNLLVLQPAQYLMIFITLAVGI